MAETRVPFEATILQVKVDTILGVPFEKSSALVPAFFVAGSFGLITFIPEQPINEIRISPQKAVKLFFFIVCPQYRPIILKTQTYFLCGREFITDVIHVIGYDMSTNTWHKDMYDLEFAAINLDGKKQHAHAKKESAFLANLLNLPKGAKVLDVPCGTARHLCQLYRHGYDLTGIDINEACLELARKNCEGLDVRLLIGNMADLSTMKGIFDATLNLFSSFDIFQR